MDAANPRQDRETILRAIGENVRRLRKARGWSQERLAYEADIDRTYIGYIENARFNVTIRILCDLANAMGVTVGELIRVD